MRNLSLRQKKVPKFVYNECRHLVYAFCRIMGYEDTGSCEADIFFLGDNPFDVVCINDDWWNMSDIYYVVSKYDKLIEKYGNDLPMVIFDWYNYRMEEDAPFKINLQSWLMGLRA